MGSILFSKNFSKDNLSSKDNFLMIQIEETKEGNVNWTNIIYTG